MSPNPDFDRLAWRNRAMAFVTRSHRHLWGKNNEDPQAFLFLQGLKNQFAKEFLLGWNKFGQERPLQNWGFHNDAQTGKTLFLPSGIVIPYIIEKKLTSVFILPYDEGKAQPVFMVPGSAGPTLVLGGNSGNRKVAVLGDLFKGLFLFQECRETFCVIIHTNPDQALEPSAASIIGTADVCFIFSLDKKEERLNRQIFSNMPESCFITGRSKEDIKKICLTDR